MKPLPLPVRVAAGLAVTAVDRARHLPEKLAELPVTMVSQALQFSMRLQQQVTELAIKGDDALSTLRPVEESPEWATFDEDATQYDAGASTNGTRSRFETTHLDESDDAPADQAAGDDDPWATEESGIQRELDNTEPDIDEPPTALSGYPDLTLPQLRARMRRLTIAELTELVDYERAHADRPEFIGMLTRRIGTLRDQR
ncbi:MAG TPA: lipid droplet-associated protein [Pseudonocardiaceae bacterium]